MLRLTSFAIALAGVLAATQPVFADPLAVAAADHTQVAAPALEQRALSAPVGSSSMPAWSSSSDAQAPTDAGLGKNIPVGFGWG